MIEKKTIWTLVAALGLTLGGVSLTGCEKDAGDNLEDAADNVGDAAEDAANNATDTIEDATE